MATKKSVAVRVAEARNQVLEEARLTDLRRQAQIANQVEIINRLQEDRNFAVDIHLSTRLADTEVILAETRVEVSRLQAEIDRLQAEKAEG